MSSLPLPEEDRCYPSIVDSLDELVDGKASYSTIYADPPWDYCNRSSRAAAVNHYSTMSMTEICELPIASLAGDDCHLHLWTTNGFLREAFDVISAWGFEYKSCFVWVKPTIGMGNYWRVSHEFLLFAKRGRINFRNKSVRSWGEYKRLSHSKKPEEVRKLVETVSPGPYLELFGRVEIPNSEWTIFGKEVEKRLF